MTFFIILLALCSITHTTHPPRLLIKIPTRSRPEKFFQTLDLYYKHLSGKIPYHFLISCDIDDHTMNNPVVIEQLKSYPHLSFSFCINQTKVEAYNRDLHRDVPFDILLLTSDDMIPCYHNYDQLIAELMLESFPDFDGVLNFYDGIVGKELNTLPVIGKKFFDRFGYAYHPAYTSLCCDLELTEVSRMLNKEKVCDTIIIKHLHPVYKLAAWDDLYRRNESFLEKDKAIFKERQARSFDLESSTS